MASLLEMPRTVDEAFARMDVAAPSDVELADIALRNYMSGGSFGRRTAWSIFHDMEKTEPDELQAEKQSSWGNLQLQMLKLSLLDHMDDRLELVRHLKDTPDADMEARYRELFEKQIVDARTDFLLIVMASITTKPLPREG
jgi:hypothetical protein